MTKLTKDQVSPEFIDRASISSDDEVTITKKSDEPIDSLSIGQGPTAFTDRMQENGGIKIIKKAEPKK